MCLKSNELLVYLGKSRGVQTLLCLYKAENKGLDEVLREIGGSKSTGMERISELLKLGLVTKKASITEKRKMIYCLEPKGKQIAEHLYSIIKTFDEAV
jgi:DNA-binding MarR family transcriptional regulator